MIWALSVFFLLIALYLFLIAPSRRGKDISKLLGWHYAHRGLFDIKKGVPENSLAAIQNAVTQGYGIELDVQLTLDGEIAVFHDKDLRRMCGMDVALSKITSAHLNTCHLSGTSETIPLFSAVLEAVGGRVPLIVEIKHYGNIEVLSAKVHELLSRYKGPYCVESFHPLAMRWFKKNAPEVIRGQLASGIISGETPKMLQRVLKYLLLNIFSRPDFIAYDVRSNQNTSLWLLRRIFKPLFVAWTIRSRDEESKAQRHYDLQIFEGHTPGH